MGMRVNSSSTSATQTGTPAWQQRKQDVDDLAQALKSNNLDAAKAAYASLAKNAPAGAANNPNSPLAQIGKALQSGDINGAQQAFSSMNARHRHGSGGGGGTGSVPTSTTPAPSPATSTLGNYLNAVA